MVKGSALGYVLPKCIHPKVTRYSVINCEEILKKVTRGHMHMKFKV
jgi:hypothetical protein